MLSRKRNKRKPEDYVYVKGEYQTTLQNTNNYLRSEKKINKNKILSYCETSNICKYIYANKIENNGKVVLHYVKLT